MLQYICQKTLHKNVSQGAVLRFEYHLVVDIMCLCIEMQGNKLALLSRKGVMYCPVR